MKNLANSIYEYLRDINVQMFIIPSLLLLFILITSIVLSESQQFSLLAQAFQHGQLNFLHPIGGAGQDPVYFHHKIYWSEGAFPSILLLPFVALFSIFHLFFYQGYLQWILVLGVWFFVFKLARKLAYSKNDSTLLAFGFSLSSVFIGVASAAASWYFAQVVTTFLVFFSLYVYFVNKRIRWWLVGTLCAFVLLTRVTASPILIFFLLELWRSKVPSKTRKLLELCLPIALAFLLMAVYNYLRFHSPFEAGYKSQLLFPISQASENQGLFSIVHLPSNLYSFLLSSPSEVFRSGKTWTLKFPYVENNIYGMSIFITSPYFLYLFTKKFSSFNTQARHLLIAALVSAGLVLTYFGIGLTQFGYRYSLDFLPELFLVFMMVYQRHNKQLSTGMKALLLSSGVVNFYLLMPLIL